MYSEVYKEEVYWKVEEKEAAGQWELGTIDDDVVTS